MRSVTDFGAMPDHLEMDSTIAFQAALNTKRAVSVPWGRYRITKPLGADQGSQLIGEGIAYDPMWAPWAFAQGPTLLIEHDQGEAAITFWGSNAGLERLIIAYPNQAPPSSSAPIPYPPTILAKQPVNISRCYLPNSFDGIEVWAGRTHIENSLIGAYRNGIVVDNALDEVRIDRVYLEPFWEWWGTYPDMVPFPNPIDWWVMAHGTGIVARKADGFRMRDVLVFGKNTGIRFEKSTYRENGVLRWPDGAVSGSASDINLDTVMHGVIAQASEERIGYNFANLHLGPFRDKAMPGYVPGHAVWLQQGPGNTSAPPRISVNGGSIRDLWAKKADGTDWAFRNDWGTRLDGGQLFVKNVIGYDDQRPRL